MGRRGPTANPELVALRGGRNRRPGSAPTATPGPVPPAPAHLCELARSEWERVAPMLAEAGLLTPAAMGVFEGYCDAYGKFRQASEMLRRDGLTYETVTKSGSPLIRARPETAIVNRALTMMRSFACELGLTPASRARLSVVPPRTRAEAGQEAADDAFFNRRRKWMQRDPIGK